MHHKVSKHLKNANLKGILCLLLISFLWISPAQVSAQIQRVSSHSVSSSILKRHVGYSILLPEDYFSGNTQYPVVYLLHGFGGDEGSWLNRCKIQTLTDSLRQKSLIREFIYVMPDADNSYYINNYNGKNNYMDFFITELMPEIDSQYRVLKGREHVAILGLSMGGFGAITLPAMHPDKFGTSLALSAAVRTPEIFQSLSQSRYEQYFADVYGPGLSNEERITEHWKANSPYFIIDSTRAEAMRSLTWYIDCGLDDFLLPANEAFHEHLSKNNIPHDFHIRPGSHNWQYWYKATVHALIFLSAQYE